MNSSIRLNPDTFLVSEEPYKTNIKYSIRHEDISLDKTQNIGNISIKHTSFAVQDSNVSHHSITSCLINTLYNIHAYIWFYLTECQN